MQIKVEQLMLLWETSPIACKGSAQYILFFFLSKWRNFVQLDELDELDRIIMHELGSIYVRTQKKI